MPATSRKRSGRCYRAGGSGARTGSWMAPWGHRRRHSPSSMPGRGRGAALAVLAALGAAWAPRAVAAAGGCVTSDPDNPPDSVASSTTVLFVSTLLVVVSVLFEKGEETLMEHVGRHARPVIVALFGELTLLGVIGLLLFLLELSPLLTDISTAVFGDGNPGHLLHIVHEVHMVLFLVMVIFLTSVMLLVVLAHRLERNWHAFETQALDKSGTIRKAVATLKGKNETGGCAKFTSWCCESRQNRTKEELIYAALRARFIDPLDEQTDGVDYGDEEPVLAKDGEYVTMNLTVHNAGQYRKRFTVYAFQSPDPIEVKKHWGLSAGQRDDWLIVGPENDIYTCPNDLFLKSYSPIKGKLNEYRKTEVILARRMEKAFAAKTKEGDANQRGIEGSYLVQPLGREIQYAITEEEFHKTYEPADPSTGRDDSHKLRADFDFGQYLSLLMGHTLAEIVEVKIVTWVSMEAIIILFWAIFNIDGSNAVFGPCVVAFGYGLVALTIAVYRKVVHIRTQLTSPIFMNIAASLSDEDVSGLGADSAPGGASTKVAPAEAIDQLESPSSSFASVRMKEAAADARCPFEKTPPVKPRSEFWSRWLGRPGNRHERLFWFDRHGPHFLLHLFRIILLAMAVYISSAAVLFKAEVCSSAGGCVLGYVALGIPPIAIAVILPVVIELTVLVSNVESMKKRYTIAEVTRQQKTVRSMRALRLLTAMKVYVLEHQAELGAGAGGSGTVASAAGLEGKEMEPALAAASTPTGKSSYKYQVTAPHESPRKGVAGKAPYFHGAAVEVYGAGTARFVRRRHELEEAFSLFDREVSGKVNVNDVQAVLELVGIADTSVDVAKLIVDEIDYDKTGTIEFQEFFDWMAAKEASARDKAEELVDHIFKIIDRDNSGTITAVELKTTLSSLGEVMSHDDVQHIVREADENGDGVIDVHEFAEMMRRSFEHSEFFL